MSSEADRLQREIDSSFTELQLNLAIHRARLDGLADVGRPPVVTHDPACICEACDPYDEYLDEAAWWAHVARLVLVGVAAGLAIAAICFLTWRLA